jgi:hypothetical protein
VIRAHARASQSRHNFVRKDVPDSSGCQELKPPPCPRALSKSGARGPSGVALFNCCNGLVGQVRPAMSAGRRPARRALARTRRPAHKRGWAGAWAVPAGFGGACACSKFKRLSPSAGRCAFRPPPLSPVWGSRCWALQRAAGSVPNTANGERRTARQSGERRERQVTSCGYGCYLRQEQG